MSYDTPQRETYHLASSAFGATTATRTIESPKGKKGLVREIIVELTAAAVGTTAVPEIDVGTVSGATEYARFRLGSAAGTGYGTGVHRARSLVTGNPTPPVLSDFTGHVALETASIPADTEVIITAKQGSGGTPAGTGIVSVVIDWF